MVTLSLFIESSLQIHCIRYQSEGTSLLITCPQLTAEHTPLLDAAAILWLLLWLMLCNTARANTNALITIPTLLPRTVSRVMTTHCKLLSTVALQSIYHVSSLKSHSTSVHCSSRYLHWVKLYIVCTSTLCFQSIWTCRTYSRSRGLSMYAYVLHYLQRQKVINIDSMHFDVLIPDFKQ